jgi:DNA-binding LacI/PurR family transcriptional regulator
LISLKRIAKLCGVSEATVSMALRDKPGVSPLTRDRVVSIAEKYNYRPNALVRSIQQKRSMTVGVACNTFEYEFPGRIMNGIMKVMSSNGYEVFVISWNTQMRDGAHVFRSMGERRVDGILMYPPDWADPRTYLEAMRSFHAPLVLVDQTQSGIECDFIGSDDVRGGFELMDYVLKLGHRKIGLITDRRIPRFAGFCDAMLRHGAAIREEWMSPFMSEREVYAAAKKMLGGDDRPTAIVCGNDIVAMVTCGAACDLGLRVPRDLSVTGFADMMVSREIRPRITTVRQDAEEMGRQAAEFLLRRIREGQNGGNKAGPEKVLLPTELIVRESTAPPEK